MLAPADNAPSVERQLYDEEEEDCLVDSTPLSTTPVLAQRWAVWSIHN